jgi:pentatricopeptide repeat protein
LTLIQVAKDKGLPLDSYFYTAAIEASDWSNAVRLLNEMEQNGILPTEVSYSVTIKVCGQNGQWEMALSLLESMRQKKYMSINIYVYNAALAALAKAAKQRMKHMNIYNANNNIRNYNSTNNSQLLSMKVKSLLSKMRVDNIEPDGFSYTSAISCYGSEGLWEEAVQLIDVMKHGKANIQPNKVAYTAAIISCGRSGQSTIAKQLFQQMQEQGHKPDTVAYNALFSAYRMANSTEHAYELWKEMIGKETIPNASKNVHINNNNNISFPTMPSSNRIRPDIITVTE